MFSLVSVKVEFRNKSQAFSFFGCTGSLLLHEGFLQLQTVGATLYLWCKVLLQWLLVLQSTCSSVSGLQELQHMGSLVAAHRLWKSRSVISVYRICCSTVRGIFLDQGSNLCLLHWQPNSYPLDHQGSPPTILMFTLLRFKSSQLCFSLKSASQRTPCPQNLRF